MSRFAGNTRPARREAGAAPSGVVLALCGVQFVDVLGVTVVITALPRMLRDLDATAAQGTVVVTAYALFFGGLLMVAARVGERVGHRRALLAALVLFAAASGLGAWSPSVWLLAVARSLQGVAAAVSVPSALWLLTTLVPEGPARRRAVAGWGAAGAAAGASGFVVGGLLTELASWRLLFWTNIALAAVLAYAVVRLVAPDQPHPEAARMAWPSAVLLTAGAMGLVAGASLLGEPTSRGLGGMVTAAGVLAAACFVRVERRAADPLVAPAARRSPRLRWGTVGSFLNTATTSSSFTVATLYLQDRLGLTALGAASLLVTFSLLVVVGSGAAPRLVAALGWSRALCCGLGCIAAGNLVLVAWPQVAGIGVAAGICGLGIGIGAVAATDMGTAVDGPVKSTAAGVLNTAAQLGTAIGTALVLLVATASEPRAAWAVVAVCAGAGALAAGRRAPAGPGPRD